MTKTSHVGKSSKDKQLYFDVFSHAVGDSTVQDDYTEPSPLESDVPERTEGKVERKPSRRKYRGSKGLNGHFQKNLATYVVGILGVVVVLVVSVGFTMNGNVERMSSQVQAQRDTITRLEGEINQVKNTYQSDIANLQGKLQDYLLRIQEQAFRIQFLEKSIQKPNP